MADFITAIVGMLFFFCIGLMVGERNYAKQLRKQVERGDASLFIDGVWIMVPQRDKAHKEGGNN